MSFYLDEDLSPTIADILRGRGLDVTSAHQVGTTQLSDDQQLQHATHANRALVTRNVRDYVLLANTWIARGQNHQGIILIPASFRGDEYAAIADAVERVARANPDGLGGAVVFVNRK